MATEKQIEANRANAQKSTGPKTAEGKARSRRNALKHGLAGAGDVLPPEDEALFQERLQAWTRDAAPTDQIQSYVLATAVLATVRLDRCARNETAVIARKRQKAIARWDEQQDQKLAQLETQLAECPCRAIAGLQQTTAGCGWLVERWNELAELLEQPGGWQDAQVELACWMLGDGEAAREAVVASVRGHARAIRETNAPDAREALGEIIATERARLESRREDLWRNQDGPELAEAINFATFDDSKAGELRHRYLTAAHREMTRALGLLLTLQKEAARIERDEQKAGTEGSRICAYSTPRIEPSCLTQTESGEVLYVPQPRKPMGSYPPPTHSWSAPPAPPPPEPGG